MAPELVVFDTLHLISFFLAFTPSNLKIVALSLKLETSVQFLTEIYVCFSHGHLVGGIFVIYLQKEKKTKKNQQ